MIGEANRKLGIVLSLCLLLGACNNDNASKEGRDTSEAQPTPSAVQPEPAAPPAPWYEGSWRAQLKLEENPSAMQIDVLERSKKKSRARETKNSAKKKADSSPEEAEPLRELEVSVIVGSDRQVTGTARLSKMHDGHSEELQVRGVLEEQTLRATVVNERMRGTLVATQSEGEGLLSGKIRISATSLVLVRVPVRSFWGTVELKREP